MTPCFEVLYLDKDFVVIDKPEGFHVHRSSFNGAKLDKVVLQNLRDQMSKAIYPVHRLDAATSGCLMFAFSSEAASLVSQKVQNHELQKTYLAVVRGWAEACQKIEIPLESKNGFQEATTFLKTISKIDLPEPIGKHASSRYSLIELRPLQGRFHQLRRHMNRVSMPIVGDVMHGDRHHNRFFKEKLNIQGLCLRASRLTFEHPESRSMIDIHCHPNSKWKKIFEIFDHDSSTFIS